MSNSIKTLNVLFQQMALRKLGAYCSSYLGNDIYFFIESINLIISDIGEDYIREILKKENLDYDKFKTKISEINELSNKIKIWYDGIIDKRFEKKDESSTQKMFKNYFHGTVKNMSLYQPEIYKIFALLVKNTSIGKQTIRSDAFKVIEHTGFKKLEYKVNKTHDGMVKK